MANALDEKAEYDHARAGLNLYDQDGFGKGRSAFGAFAKRYCQTA